MLIQTINEKINKNTSGTTSTDEINFSKRRSQRLELNQPQTSSLPMERILSNSEDILISAFPEITRVLAILVRIISQLEKRITGDNYDEGQSLWLTELWLPFAEEGLAIEQSGGLSGFVRQTLFAYILY